MALCSSLGETISFYMNKTSEIVTLYRRGRLTSVYGQGHREDELALFPKEAETIHCAQENVGDFSITLLWKMYFALACWVSSI